MRVRDSGRCRGRGLSVFAWILTSCFQADGAIDIEYIHRSPESGRKVAPFPTSSTYALRSRELMLTQDEE